MKLVIATVITALLCAAPAQADPSTNTAERDYIHKYAAAICYVIKQGGPSEDGMKAAVEAAWQMITMDGFDAETAVDIINYSVHDTCPRYWPLLQEMGAEARGEGPLRRAI